MQHHDPPADQCAEEDSRYTIGTLESQLKEPFAEGVCMRRPEVGTYRCHAARQHDVPSSKRVGKREDLLLDGFAVVLDAVVRARMVTNMLTASKPSRRGSVFGSLTFELSGRRRQDARPGLAKMYRVPPDRAWWPAVGAPLERGVRPRCAAEFGLQIHRVGL